MHASPITHLVGLGLIILIAVLCALVLRSARLPGWRVLGGLLAGIILGPTIFGAIMPDRYESLYLGGVQERQDRDAGLRRQDAETQFALQAGTEPDALAEMKNRHESERNEAQVALHEAKWEYQKPQRLFASCMIAMVLLGAFAFGVGGGDRRQGIISPITIGLWAAMLPGVIVFGCAWKLWGVPMAEAILFASGFAIGPWALAKVDRQAADDAEHGGAEMIQFAGRMASIIGITMVVGAIWKMGGTEKLIWASPLLAMPLGWLIPASWGKFFRGFLELVLLPVLATCVAMKVNFIRDFHIWMVFIALIFSGDGRWLGAYFGAMSLGGRKSLRTMRLILGVMACGPTMLAIAGIGIYSASLSGQGTLALLLGAAMIELTTPARRATAKRLLMTEREIEEISSKQE